MRTIVIIISVMLFTGCGLNRKVYVPVSSCPKPPACGDVLQAMSLPKSATTIQKLEALRADYFELYRCKLLLDAYRAD